MHGAPSVHQNEVNGIADMVIATVPGLCAMSESTWQSRNCTHAGRVVVIMSEL